MSDITGKNSGENKKSFNFQLTKNLPLNNEFLMTDSDYKFLIDFIYKHIGIVITEEKRAMIYSRLSRRLRKLQLKSFKDYCQLLSADQKQEELPNLINAVTTNLTKFFREEYHFEHLKNDILLADHPILSQNRENLGRKKLKIWSAGCSTGEEPYSIALTLLETIKDIYAWDISILATDIDTNVLSHASEGVYKDNGTLPKTLVQKYTESITPDSFRFKPNVKKLIEFKQLNFNKTWPALPIFDIIFCRNVVIYFDRQTQLKLFNSFADHLIDRGFLYIGHSENLYKLSDRFAMVGRTTYQKKGV